MSLHLVVPGLLWPSATLRETCRDLPLPSLSALLGRGERKIAHAASLLDWLAATFSLSGDELPWGALRLSGESGASADGVWLCADPAHLRFARDTLVLADAHELAVTADEAEQLTTALNSHLADVGRFHAASPERWYLGLDAAPRLRTQPLERVVGRSFDQYLPEGDDARRWRAVLNEAQMLLHAHPVNAAREAAGQPVINSLWLWGAGSLPRQDSCPFGAVFADDPLVLGLARGARAAAARLPRDAAQAIARADRETVLVLADLLRAAETYRDASLWRSQLVRLEQEWLAPLLGALYGGSLRELRLTGLGDEAAIEVALTAADRWKFWRRPVALGDLDRDIAAS